MPNGEVSFSKFVIGMGGIGVTLVLAACLFLMGFAFEANAKLAVLEDHMHQVEVDIAEIRTDLRTLNSKIIQ